MIDQFIKQLSTGLEQTVDMLGKLPKEEIQTHLNQVAKNTLTKMDLVTREDFELQTAMLVKYRERLVALESRIAALEKAEVTPKEATPVVKKAPAKRAPAKKAAPKTSAPKATQAEEEEKPDDNV